MWIKTGNTRLFNFDNYKSFWINTGAESNGSPTYSIKLDDVTLQTCKHKELVEDEFQAIQNAYEAGNKIHIMDY